MKPFFSDKTPYTNSITLLGKNGIVTDNKACAEIFNNFFSNSARNLEIDRELYVHKGTYFDDPIYISLKNSRTVPVFYELFKEGICQIIFLSN